MAEDTKPGFADRVCQTLTMHGDIVPGWQCCQNALELLKPIFPLTYMAWIGAQKIQTVESYILY